MFGQVLAGIRGIDIGDIRLAVRRLENPRLYGAWAAVIALHLVAIWFLAAGLVAPHGAPDSAGESQVILLPSAAPAQATLDPIPEPQMQAADPAAPEIAAPQIDVDMATPTAASGVSQAAILPPRPDPAFRNVSPPLPASFAKAAGVLDVLLTVRVEADGGISDARVAHSSGQTVLDQLAAQFVKTQWRFRAATQGGKAVADWTTVLVRFARAG